MVVATGLRSPILFAAALVLSSASVALAGALSFESLFAFREEVIEMEVLPDADANERPNHARNKID